MSSVLLTSCPPPHLCAPCARAYVLCGRWWPSGHAWGIPRPDQRDKERERRLQETRARPGEGRGNTATKTTTRHSQQTADGSAVSTVTKTERLVHSSKGPSRAQGSGWEHVYLAGPCAPHTLPLIPAPADDGRRTARTTTVESSFVRRSESKAARRLLMPACQPTFLKLSLRTSICVSLCPAITFSSLPVAASIPLPASCPISHIQPRTSPCSPSPFLQMVVAAP